MRGIAILVLGAAMLVGSVRGEPLVASFNGKCVKGGEPQAYFGADDTTEPSLTSPETCYDYCVLEALGHGSEFI